MTTDEQQIRALWQQMEQGWAAGSGDGFARPFAEDADFVSVRGESVHGRAPIARRHQRLLATVYAGSTLSAEVGYVRYLRADLALVHAVSTVTSPGGSQPFFAHAQAITEQRRGSWQIIAFHNMVPASSPPPTTPTGEPS